MDSTAFSMHFRSLARSDSGGELKTPTGVRLAFGEKTPTQDGNPNNAGSSMVLTVAKKPNSQCFDKATASGDSNEMSLVGENPNRYDYGRLSPELDALLAEGSRNLNVVSVSNLINSPKSSNYLNKGMNTGNGIMNLMVDGGLDLGNNINTHKATIKKLPITHFETSETNAGFVDAPVDQITSDSPPKTNDGPVTNSSSHQQISIPSQPSKVRTFLLVAFFMTLLLQFFGFLFFFSFSLLNGSTWIDKIDDIFGWEKFWIPFKSVLVQHSTKLLCAFFLKVLRIFFRCLIWSTFVNILIASYT